MFKEKTLFKVRWFANFQKSFGRDRLSVIVGMPLAAVSFFLYRNSLLLLDIPGWISGSFLPMALDFANIWCAALLALAHQAEVAYDIYEIQELQQNIFGMHGTFGGGWFYPPTFQLMILPLGYLSYLSALIVWLLVTMAGYLLVVLRISRHFLILFMALTFPSALINIIQGQNGFLSAFLLGGGLLLLDRYPIWSGILFGLLTYKPNIALLIVVALAAGRYWKSLIAAVASTLAFALASLLTFGVKPWLAFWVVSSTLVELLEMGVAPWVLVPTFFSTALSLGYGVREAYAVQGVSMIIAVAAIFWTWSRKTSLASRGSVLVLGILLFSPYLTLYDCCILALALAWLWQDGYDHGRLWGERSVLLAAWTMPYLSQVIWFWQIMDEVKLQIGPFVVCGCLLLALLRQRKEKLEAIIKNK